MGSSISYSKNEITILTQIKNAEANKFPQNLRRDVNRDVRMLQKNKVIYSLIMSLAQMRNYGAGTTELAITLNEDYFSLTSMTKEMIVRGLARALKLTGVEVDENESLENIAKSLHILPHPKNGKTFTSDSIIQEKLCKTIANVLNDEFTPSGYDEDKLIDIKLGAISICQQVFKLAHSLVIGIYAEFLEVQEILDKKPEKNNNFALAQKEITIIINNINNDCIKMNRLNLILGTIDFADALAIMVYNLTTVATISAQVNAVFKTIDIEKLT